MIDPCATQAATLRRLAEQVAEHNLLLHRLLNQESERKAEDVERGRPVVAVGAGDGGDAVGDHSVGL